MNRMDPRTIHSMHSPVVSLDESKEASVTRAYTRSSKLFSRLTREFEWIPEICGVAVLDFASRALKSGSMSMIPYTVRMARLYNCLDQRHDIVSLASICGLIGNHPIVTDHFDIIPLVDESVQTGLF